MQKQLTVSVLFYCIFFAASAQISSLTPNKIIGGISQKLIINGSNFGTNQGNSYVSFNQESGQYLDATASKALKYISWSDTKIELEMPVAFSGKVKLNINGTDYMSGDTLKVMANLGYRSANPIVYEYLTNNNNKGGYTWYIHKTYWDIPEAKAAIEAVFREFRCKTGVNYILAPFSTQVGFNLGDTFNVVAPDPQLGPVGYNERLWTSCILGNETFYNIKSHDLHLSTSQDWYYGTGECPAGKTKFRYVLYHELGHSLGLGHVNELGQSMFPSVSFLPSNTWSGRDSITYDERTAISYLINLSQNFAFRACGISPLSKIYDCQDVYGTSTSIDKVNYHQLTVYPNPANEYIFLETVNFNSEETQICVKDYTGKQVIKTMYTEEGIFVADLREGIYTIEIQTSEAYYTAKFVKY
jgi:hypothetical protein